VISVSRNTILGTTSTEDAKTASTSNGNVEVLTSMTPPTLTSGITPKKRTIKGAKDIEVIVGTSSSDITVQHSNSVTANASYSDISTNGNAQVNIVTPTYNARGHITGTANQKLTVGAATSTKLGTIRTGYTDSGANVKLNADTDGDGYVTLTKDAIKSAGGITSISYGDSQGQIKANDSNVNVTGLGTSGTPQFSQVTATTFSLTGNNASIQLGAGSIVGNTSSTITSGSFTALSDMRLKENFQSLRPEKSILSLPTYKFDFINGNKNQIGCKAQDLQEICPEIVNEDSDGYLSIQESKIVYLLLEEVKKLRKELDELKK
jgi:hypothetical protein